MYATDRGTRTSYFLRPILAYSQEHLQHEVRVMKLMRHPHVIRLYEVCNLPDPLCRAPFPEGPTHRPRRSPSPD